MPAPRTPLGLGRRPGPAGPAGPEASSTRSQPGPSRRARVRPRAATRRPRRGPGSRRPSSPFRQCRAGTTSGVGQSDTILAAGPAPATRMGLPAGRPRRPGRGPERSLGIRAAARGFNEAQRVGGGGRPAGAGAGATSHRLPWIWPGRPVTCARLDAPRGAAGVCGAGDRGCDACRPLCRRARTVPLLRSYAAMALLPRSARWAAAGDGAGGDDTESSPGRLGCTWSLPRSRGPLPLLTVVPVTWLVVVLGRRRWRTPSLSFRTRPATVAAASAVATMAVVGRHSDGLSSRSHGEGVFDTVEPLSLDFDSALAAAFRRTRPSWTGSLCSATPPVDDAKADAGRQETENRPADLASQKELGGDEPALK